MSQTSKAGLQRITYGWGREAADEVGGQIQVTAGTTEFDVARQAGPGPVKSGRAPHGGPGPAAPRTVVCRCSTCCRLGSMASSPPNDSVASSHTMATLSMRDSSPSDDHDPIKASELASGPEGMTSGGECLHWQGHHDRLR